MAQYFDDFSAYADGAIPTGWTRRLTGDSSTYSVLNNNDSCGGRSLNINNAYGIISQDAVTSDANRFNCDIVIRFKYQSQRRPYIAARSSGSIYSETMYKLSLESSAVTMKRLATGTPTTLGSVSFTPTNDSWYWMRFRLSGTSLKSKIWEDGAVQPSTWSIDVTNSVITNTGNLWVGIGADGSGTSGGLLDFVSVATNNDTVTTPPITKANTATSIGVDSATINGSLVDTGGLTTSLAFEYGLTTAYGSTVSLGNSSLGNYSSLLSNLATNQTYHFRLRATNSLTTYLSNDSTLTLITRPQSKPINLVPHTNRVWSAEEQTFTWEIDAYSNQQYYELRYRIVGGSWITTGIVTSATQSHTFPANTFAIDTNYEWQVLSWGNV